MAKIQREASEAKNQTDALRATVQQQAAQIEQLRTAGAPQVQLTTEERLAAEQSRVAEQTAAAAELEAQHQKSIGSDGSFNVRRPSQVTAMKEMVEGGLLSDEILQSAQQTKPRDPRARWGVAAEEGNGAAAAAGDRRRLAGAREGQQDRPQGPHVDAQLS